MDDKKNCLRCSNKIAMSERKDIHRKNEEKVQKETIAR